MSKQVFFYLPYLVSLLLSISPLLQTISHSEEPSSDLFEKGVAALQKGDLKKAEELFREVLKNDRENPFAYFNLGSIFAATRRIDLAVRTMNIAVDLKPDLVAAHLRLAEIYESQGNLDEAIREYEEAYLYLPDGSLSQERAIQSRLENLEQTIRFRESWERGMSALRKGNYPESEVAFRDVISLEPNNAQAYNLLGVVLGIQNRFDEAVESFKQSIRIKPGLTDSRIRLAELHQVKGELSEARTELERALLFIEDKEGAEAQSIEEKLNGIEDQIEIKPFMDRSLTEGEKNNIDSAILALQSLIKLYPNYPLAYFNLGNLWARKERLDLAEGVFKKAIEIDPNYSAAHQRLGQIYELIRYYERAKAEYQKAKDTLIGDDPARGELEQLLGRTNRVQKMAETGAEEAYRKSQNSLKEGKSDEAVSFLEQAVAIYPERSELHYQLGELYHQKNKVDLAINEMLGAIEFDPTFTPAHQRLGILYEERGYLYQAFKKWKQVDALEPSETTDDHLRRLSEKLSAVEQKTAPLIRKADQESEADRWTTAINTLKGVLPLAPDDTKIRMRLAMINLKLGNTTDAFSEWNTIALQDPEDGEAHYRLGLLYSSALLWEDAKKSFESALKAKVLPNDLRLGAQSELGRVKAKIQNEKDARRYFSRGTRYMAEQDYIAAIEFFEKVIRIYPSDLNSLYLIGYSYENLGHEREALRYYRKVLEINPKHVQANQHLGLVYERQGKTETAIRVYQDSLSILGKEETPESAWIKERLTPLEKRLYVVLSQVVLSYNSNPAGSSTPRGDLSSNLGVSLTYYLKKDQRFQLPIGLSTQNTFFYRSNTIYSNETFSLTAITHRLPYSLSFGYNASLGVARGGITGLDQVALLSLIRRGTFPSMMNLDYTYDDFFSYGNKDFDAVRQSIRFSMTQDWGTSSSTLSYRFVNNNAKLSDQASKTHGVGITYNRNLISNLKGSISYNLDWIQFVHPDSLALLVRGKLIHRENFFHSLNLSMSYPLQNDLMIGASYTEQQNYSNLPSGAVTVEQRLSGQASSLGDYRQRLINLFLNWSF